MSRSTWTDKSEDKERMKSLWKYLLEQKKATHMRNCNYQKKKEENSDDTNTAKSSSAVGGNLRGRGGLGRGDSGRGGGSGHGK